MHIMTMWKRSTCHVCEKCQCGFFKHWNVYILLTCILIQVYSCIIWELYVIEEKCNNTTYLLYSLLLLHWQADCKMKNATFGFSCKTSFHKVQLTDIQNTEYEIKAYKTSFQIAFYRDLLGLTFQQQKLHVNFKKQKGLNFAGWVHFACSI